MRSGYKAMMWCLRIAIATLVTTPSNGEVTRISVGEDNEALRHRGYLRSRRTESGSLSTESVGTRRNKGGDNNHSMLERIHKSSHTRRRAQATRLWCEYHRALLIITPSLDLLRCVFSLL